MANRSSKSAMKPKHKNASIDGETIRISAKRSGKMSPDELAMLLHMRRKGASISKNKKKMSGYVRGGKHKNMAA